MYKESCVIPFLRKEADSVDRKIDAMGERAREEEAAKVGGRGQN